MGLAALYEVDEAGIETVIGSGRLVMYVDGAGGVGM
jgi:hypothetical protein